MHPYNKDRLKRYFKRNVTWDNTTLILIVIAEVVWIYYLYLAVRLVWDTIGWTGGIKWI